MRIEKITKPKQCSNCNYLIKIKKQNINKQNKIIGVCLQATPAREIDKSNFFCDEYWQYQKENENES